jgi:hypothetical protein
VLPIPDAGTIAIPAPGVLAAAEIKSCLDRPQMKAAMGQLAALRGLSDYHRGKVTAPPLAPKSYVVAFESEWKSIEAVKQVFLELTEEQRDDHLRINGLVLLDKNAMIVRRAATVTAKVSTGNVIGDFLAKLLAHLARHGRCPGVDLSPFVNVIYPPDDGDSSGYRSR